MKPAGHIIDKLILNELKKGRSTPAILTEDIDAESSQYVWSRLQELTKKEKVKRVAKGLYERC